MSHYFTDNTHLKTNRREISFRFCSFSYTIVTDDGVFSKDGFDYGTKFLLACSMPYIMGDSKVLDLGCGYGVVGVILKRENESLDVTMCDVNPRAVELSKENMGRYHLEASIVESDGFQRMEKQQFDRILSNPPIHAGKKWIYQMFHDSYQHLKKNGELWVVIRKQHGAKSAIEYLSSFFQDCKVVNRSKGFWVLRCQKSR